MSAEALKAQGTEKYKLGDFKGAIELFAKAAKLQPDVPVRLVYSRTLPA